MRIDIPARGPSPNSAAGSSNRPLPTRSNASRVKRSGTVTRANRSSKTTGAPQSSEDEGYEGDVAKEEDDVPDSPMNAKTPVAPDQGRFANGRHGRQASSPTGTPTRRTASTAGSEASFTSANRENFARSRPFPTPGVKEPSCDPLDAYAYKSVEEKRLEEDERKEKHWKRWGPYLSERQWVRISFSRSLEHGA